ASIFLYGQHQIGKTSLLKNLIALFGKPQQVVALFIDLQGIAIAGNNITGFFENVLAYQIQSNAKQYYQIDLPKFTITNDPYIDFNAWLDEIQQAYLKDKVLILLLDEFSKLNAVIQENESQFDHGRLDDMLRFWIQNRDNFQFVVSSQRKIDVKSWSSLVNSIEAVPISYLTEAEAKQLIEAPVKDFALQYESAATEEILRLTRRHPALIKYLCKEIIALKNTQNIEQRFLANLQDVLVSIPKVLETAMAVLSTNEARFKESGQQVLRYIAQQNKPIDLQTLKIQAFDDLEENLELAEQLAILEKTEDKYQFQVELLRLYFAQQKN
ncbi:MAG: hypothetical protein VSS52_006035, partial [Thiotrichaceae bacterium]|nr:hypothetical protein [Thiotrichaceae bacterium]